MPRITFELNVPVPPERALTIARNALAIAGYRDESVEPTRGVLVRTETVRGGPMGAFHTIRIAATPSEGGARLAVEVDAPLGTAADEFGQIRATAESVLRERFFEGSPFRQGRVSDDGTRVVLDRPIEGISFNFIRNRIGETSIGFRGLLLGAGVTFYGVGAIYAWDTVLRGREPFNPAILVGFLLIGSLGFVPGVYAMVSRRFPTAVLPSPRGIALRFRGGRTMEIPWGRIRGLQSDPYDAGAQKLVWSDAAGRTRKTKMGGEGLNAVTQVRKFMDQAREVGVAAFEAFNIAPPGTRVLVAPRFLTNPEMEFRKVGRRFLPAGRVDVPIYVTTEDDAAIVSEYIATHRLDLAGLKAIGTVAINHGLWELGVAVFRAAREHAPDDPDVGMNLAGCLLRAKKPAEALAVVDELLRKAETATLYTMRAAILMQMEHVEDALHAVGKAVEREPDSLEALHMWFDLVASHGGIPEAVAELDYLASQRPGAWGPNLVLGFRLLEGGRFDEAAERMRRAYGAAQNEHTLYGLTSSLLQQRKVDDVVRLVEDARRSGTVGAAPQVNLAHAYAARGESEAALDVLNRIDAEVPPEMRPSVDRLRAHLEGRA